MLPVIRHDPSSEPKVLILASDGWEGDLSQLELVLEAWIQQDYPGLGQNEAEDKRPQLRYDEDESAGDQKTVVVRAWRFKNEWVDSLASRLGREFRFYGVWRSGESRNSCRITNGMTRLSEFPEKSFRMDDGSALTVESSEISAITQHQSLNSRVL